MKKTHEPPRKYRKSARARGAQIEKIVLCWIRRWGYTSDKVLEYLYPPRRRLGYDLSRKGRLKKWPADPGYRLDDGPAFYGLNEYADSILEEALDSEILDIEHSAKPALSTMQHLLDCQRIAIALGMLPDATDWRTEPEMRAISPEGAELVPDMRAYPFDRESGDTFMNWIEYDRTAKSNVVLDHFTQRLARRVEAAHDEKRHPKDRPEPIGKITIVVRTDYQLNRYKRYFEREYADYLYRDKDSRKLKKAHQQPRQPIREVLGDLVTITTLRELVHYDFKYSPEERIEWMGLADTASKAR